MTSPFILGPRSRRGPYDIKITLKSQVCHGNVKIVSLCMQSCYGPHYIKLLNMLTTSGLFILLHRGSYMSAHVLLSLLNKFRKSDKMRGLLSILSLFRNEFNKLNRK